MTIRNSFINAALEELRQETTAVEQPIATQTEGVALANAGEVTETNVDDSKDAVAELMEKNAELVDANSALEEEVFDNDLGAIETVSDSVHEDLEEAVAAGVALENLAHLANLTAKSGQANMATVAGLTFAMEQIADRIGISSHIPALEDGELANYDGSKEEQAKAQAEEVGKAAEEKAQTIFQRIVDGIKRIFGWLMNVMRQIFASYSNVARRAEKVAANIDKIDESKTIDSKPFISSLRLVEGAGDPDKQFEEYAKLSTKTLFGFFNSSFVSNLAKAGDAIFKPSESDTDKEAINKQLIEILRVAMGTIFTEHADGSVVSAQIPAAVQEKDLTVGKTVPCVGGVQLYLAATLDGSENWFCRAGAVKEAPKFAMPESIPVAKKADADKMFALIQKWMNAHRDLQSNLNKLRGDRLVVNLVPKNLRASAAYNYVSVLSAIATSILPQLLRLNLHNANSYISYVEKSIAVSKVAEKTAEAK